MLVSNYKRKGHPHLYDTCKGVKSALDSFKSLYEEKMSQEQT